VFRHIVAVDWEQVRFRRALSGLVAILVALAFIGVVETVVLIVIMATLFNIAAANDGPMERRWRAMAQFSVSGAVAGGLAFWSIDNASGTALVLGVVTYLATLIAALGQRQARAGLFLTLWVVIAMIIGTTETSPLIVSIAFIIGGGVAIAITALRLRITGEDPADDASASVGEVDPNDVAPVGSVATRLKWASRTSMGAFAVVRAFAVVVATLVGFWLFPDYAFWATITVIIVVKPSASQTASIAMERTLGTALGALVAVMTVQLFPGNQVYAAFGFMVSAFFMVAFMNANYTLFAAFLTSTLVFALRMGQADAFDGGIERVGATLAGAVISLVTVGIGHLLITHRAGHTQQS
jgi:hypothetical protein